MKKTVILFLIPLLFCCKSKDKYSEKQDNYLGITIDTIYVSYYNYYFTKWTDSDFEHLKTAHRPTFQKEHYGTKGNYRIDYQGVIDTILTDCNILTSIENELKKSIRNDMFINIIAHDARMSTVIVYKNGNRDTLLFDEDVMYYVRRNEGYENLEGLNYLLRKNIGYYSWQKKDASYLTELDTLNRRDSIKIWLDNNPKVASATLD